MWTKTGVKIGQDIDGLYFCRPPKKAGQFLTKHIEFHAKASKK